MDLKIKHDPLSSIDDIKKNAVLLVLANHRYELRHLLITPSTFGLQAICNLHGKLLILTKLARQDVDDLGTVRLRAAYLKNIMYQSSYAEVVDALRKGGVVKRFPYTVGHKSYGFRLTHRFAGDKHVRVPATDQRLIGRMATFHEWRETEQLARLKPVHLALARQQKRLQIRGRTARRILNGLPPQCNHFGVQGLLVDDIEIGDFHVNVGRCGRMTNNITSLKRELRSTLHVDDERLTCVDLACAQPALLGMIIREKPRGQTAGEGRATKQSKYDSSLGVDFDHYLDLVQAGGFYDFLVDHLQNRGIDRDAVKQKFLSDVIAKKGKYPSIVEDCFSQCFPNVYRFIRWVNKVGREHANLIRLLQRAESEFVIESVAADLVTRFPGTFFITLHDAIYTTRRHVGKVEQAFRRAFKRSDLPMQYKVSC